MQIPEIENALMKKIIEDEIAQIERSIGRKASFRCVKKAKNSCWIRGLLISLITINTIIIPIIVIIYYLSKLKGISAVSELTALAKKYPDRQISEVVRGDLV